MDASQGMIVAGAAIAATPVVLGVLGWSLRRNVKSQDARDEETRRIAVDAAARAEKVGVDLAEVVRKEIAASGEATRGAVAALGAEVGKLSGIIGSHGERLARGDVKIESVEDRLKGLEERERERGCFPGCAFRESHGRGDGG